MTELENIPFSKIASALEIQGTRIVMYRELQKFVKQYVTGSVALDYGCGPGQVTRLLRPCGLKVDAVDIDEDVLKVAKQADPLGNYTAITSGVIPSSDRHYDFILAAFVFSYVKTKEEILKIFREFYRCLKDDGIVIIMVPIANFYQCNYVSFAGLHQGIQLRSGDIAKFKTFGGFIMKNYYWSEEDYNELITNAGFHTIQVDHPLGLESDGVAWLDETDKPPSATYIVRKKSSM